MTILSNGKKNIRFSLNNEIKELKNETTMYVLNTTAIICSNKEDAEIIQQKLNSFISDISHDLLAE